MAHNVATSSFFCLSWSGKSTENKFTYNCEIPCSNLDHDVQSNNIGIFLPVELRLMEHNVATSLYWVYPLSLDTILVGN
jgi:hypothetical protein